MIDLRNPTLTADAVICGLGLQPHPEGGHYRETWRDAPAGGSRGAATSIHFLLRAEELSAWHRVDAAELWIWQAGSPLVLTVSADGHDASAHILGADLGLHQAPQRVVPQGHWQTAACMGLWTLVCCVVAPAFRFEGFELAPADWRPTRR